MGETPSVFISYARKDGRAFASKLRQELRNADFALWQDIISLEAGEKWWEQIRTAIDNVHTMVLLLTPEALFSKNVRREWVYARRVGTHILPVTNSSKIFASAPRWIQQIDVLDLSEDNPDLVEARERFLTQLLSPAPRRPIPFMVPPLPPEHVLRTKAQNEVMSSLVDDFGDPRQVKLALIGAGGFGKSTLIQALCHEPELIEAFSDGVLWVTIGEESRDLSPQITEVVNALTGTRRVFNTTEEASRNLRDLLIDRECLLVLDDVWDAIDIKPFEGQDNCTRLFTTRSTSVGAHIGDKIIHVNEMEPQEAVQMLVNHLLQKEGVTESNYHELTTLARRLGEWALLLHIIGGALRVEMMAGQSLENALIWVNGGLDEEGLTAFDATNPKERNQALKASVDVSLRKYTDEERLRLYELSIFAEDTLIPDSVIKALWFQTAKMSNFASEKLLRRFSGQFLVLTTNQNHVIQIRLHDAMRAHLSSELTELERQKAHNLLLEALNPGGKPWQEIADDGYLYDYLTYHLFQSERDSELKDLFRNDGWLKARFKASRSTYSGYIADLTVAWQATHLDTVQNIISGRSAETLTECIRFALIRTKINSLADNFPPELLVRAVETQFWTSTRALEMAFNITHDKLSALCALLRLDVWTPEQRSEILSRVRTALAESNFYGFSLGVASNVAEFLDPSERDQLALMALEGTEEIAEHNEESLVVSLAKIAKYAPATIRKRLISSAFQIASRITHNWSRSRAYLALGLSLGGNQRRQALLESLNAAILCDAFYGQTKMLVLLAPHLNKKTLATVLNVANEMKYHSNYIQILAAVVPRLTNNYAEILELYEEVKELEFEDERARAVISLLPTLKGADRVEALAVAVESAIHITIQSAQQEVLGLLSPFLDTTHLQHIFNSFLSAGNKDSIIYALCSFADKTSFQQQVVNWAFQIWLEIEDETEASHALYSLAKFLTEEDLAKAFERSRSWMFDSDKVRSFSYLVPYLPEALKQEAIHDATALFDSIGGIEDFSVALVDLAPHLTPRRKSQLVRRCLQAIGDETEDYEKVVALTNLIDLAPAHVRARLRKQVWELLIQMLNEEPRGFLNVFGYAVDCFDQVTANASLQALETVREYPEYRLALAEVAMKLPLDQKEHYIDRVISIAESEDDDAENRQLISFLIKNQVPHSVERLVAIARSMKSHRERALALAYVLPYSQEKEVILTDIRKAFLSTLWSRRSSSLYYILEILYQEGFISVPIFETQQIEDIAHLVIDVCWRWEWQ